MKSSNSNSVDNKTINISDFHQDFAGREFVPIDNESSQDSTIHRFHCVELDDKAKAYAAVHQCPILKPPETLADFIDRFAYITEGSKVLDLQSPANWAVRNLNEFKNEYAGVFINDGKRQEPATKAWLSALRRQTLRGLDWRPAGDRVFSDDFGHRVGNTYEQKTYPETTDESLLGIFFDYIEYLIPQPDRQDIFLDWMACTVHQPEVRIKFVPLLIAEHQGTGRGWLAELLGCLLSHDYIKRVKIATMAGRGNDSQYHNYLFQALVCVVDEVREGKDKYSINDRIRDLLTEPRLPLNIKYGKNGTYDIFANFLMFSNHRDALVLPEEDRRMWVHETTAKPRSEAYYIRLYQWLKGDGVQQLWCYLKRRDISGFNHGMRSPDTAEKHAMIQNAKSSLEQNVDMTLGKLPDNVGVVISTQFAQMVEIITGDPVNDSDMTQLGVVLKKKARRYFDKPGAASKQIRWHNKPVRPWILKGEYLNNKAVVEALDAASLWLDSNRLPGMDKCG